MAKTPQVLYYPDDLKKLIGRGSVYMKLKFSANADEKLSQSNVKDVADTISKLNESLNDVYKGIGTSLSKARQFFDQGGALSNLATFATTFAGGGDLIASIGKLNSAAVGGALLQSAGAAGDFDKVQQRIYDEDPENVFSAHVYLPLEGLEVNRVSGVIQQNDGFAKNLAQVAILRGLRDVESTMIGDATKAQGLTLRKMMGFAMENVQFETLNLEWTFAPRSLTEAQMVEKILLFVNAACVSNIDINNKDLSNLFWVLPPRIEMGVLSSDRTGAAATSASALINTVGDYDLKSGEVQGSVFWLRPKSEYYIEEISISPANEGGSVLLNPLGRMAYTKLRIKITKTSLTSINDLFRGMGDEAASTTKSDLAQKWAAASEEEKWKSITPLT